MRRQRLMQALDLVEGHIGAGRVVRIGDEHQPRALCHRRDHRVDVGGVIFFRHLDRLAAVPERVDRIHQEAVLAVDHLVAVAQIGVRQEIQEIVGAGAADKTRRIEAECAADGRT